MNTARDVARFLVQESIDQNKLVTNMKLQKILYFAWIDYYKLTSSAGSPMHLFEDNIYAWKFGPVVPNVYREYSIFAAMPISFTKPVKESISAEVQQFLKETVKKYGFYSASDLVRISHKHGSPWSRVYRDKCNNIIIPFDMMESADSL